MKIVGCKTIKDRTKRGEIDMTVYNPKDYDNVYTGGQVQFDMENYRSAYDHLWRALNIKNDMKVGMRQQ